MELFAGMPVRDFEASLSWYERLLGSEPTLFPNDIEAVWMLEDGRAVYIIEDRERAGSGTAALIVDDLDERLEGIGSRGIEPAESETYDNGVRKITYRDADGNELAFGTTPEEE